MTQFSSTSPRRASGELDVYTGLLGAAFLVLVAGILLMAAKNIQHSETRANAADGGMFTLVTKK